MAAAHSSTIESEKTVSEDFGGDDNIFNQLMPDNNILYVICPFNIGDFLVNGGLCYALQIIKRKKTCVLIVCDKFKKSGMNFIGVSQIVYIPQELMNSIRAFIIRTGRYVTERYIYGHFHVKDGKFDWNSEVDFFCRYRENVFGLPLETEILPPILDEISDEHKQELHALYRMDKSVIILAPYANSGPQLFSDDVWIRITKRLKKKGYLVYTNVAGTKEVPIKGSIPLCLSFSELFYVADKVKCFIGRRSGIMDFLSFSEAEILCILYPECWHDDLRRNFPKKKSHAFYYAGHYMDELREYAEQNDIDDVSLVRMKFPHVNDREVFYDDDLMVNALIESVKRL